MSSVIINKIIRKYANALRQKGYPVSAVYLFGSHTKGNANAWSDIDVAIISDRLEKNKESDRLVLWKTRRNIDDRIEPHGFTEKDFDNIRNPLACEIKKTGVRII